MAESITIDRLHASYEEVTAEQAIRFDRALHDLAAGALEAELLDGPFLVPYAVCVPALAAPVVLDPSLTIAAVSQAWARQLAEAILRRLDDDDVVIYEREIDAIIDLARAVASGSNLTSRSWAWHQLGLLDAERPPRLDDLVMVLLRRTELITAVLGSFRRPFSLPLRSNDWLQVAGAVHSMLTAKARLSLSPVAQHEPTATANEARISTAIGRTAFLEQMALSDADAVIGAWRQASAESRAGLISLVLALGQPISISDPVTRHAIETRLDAVAGISRLSDVGGGIPTTGRATNDDADAVVKVRPDAGTTEATHSDGPPSGVDEDRNHSTDQPEPTDTRVDEAASAVVTTVNGGVFFLTHVIDELALVDEYLHLPGHEPGELLARVIAKLTGVKWTDPAVSTIAGIDEVDTAIANRMLAPLDPAAHQAVDIMVAELMAWLVEHVEPDHQVHVSTWSWVWRRGAKIERKPGWIEIELSVNTADPRIRRAGLDLDPGFVWWLGAVMRFRYV